MVVAIKNGKKQTFSDLAWKLLGKNTNGWEPVSTQAIENSVTSLPTGEKPVIKEPAPAQKISNSVNKQAEEQLIENATEKFEQPVMDVKGVSDEQRTAFMEGIDGLTRRAVMDLLDKEGQTYNKKADNLTLKQQLADYTGYNTDRLTEIMTK